jgi:hypothetical protein
MATKKATPAVEKTTVKKAAEKAATTKSTKTTKTTTKKAVTEADIRAKAEEIYQARVAAGTEGTPEGDWAAAEKALKAGKK